MIDESQKRVTPCVKVSLLTFNTSVIWHQDWLMKSVNNIAKDPYETLTRGQKRTLDEVMARVDRTSCLCVVMSACSVIAVA